MKFVSKGGTLSSPEFHEKKRKARRKNTIFWLIGFLILLGGVIFLSRQSKFLVSDVVVEGASVVNEDEVSARLKEIIAGYYWHLVPRANALVYPHDEIEKRLMEYFPRFASVTIGLEGMNVAKVSVHEREPYALYCGSAFRPQDATECYFIDDRGLIFDRAPAFSGTVYFIYALEEPFENPLDQAFLPEKEFKSVTHFIEELRTLGLNPLSLEVGKDEFRLVLPSDARVLWKRDADLPLIYSNLSAFLTSEAIKRQEHFLDHVTLLDLRTENKVFYRLEE